MRRDALRLPRRDIEHAGLLLDVYPAWEREEINGDIHPNQRIPAGELKAETIEAAARTPVAAGYAEAHELRRSSLLPALRSGRLELAELEVTGRMVIGLGQKGVIEAGMTLDRTWGVPVIPGSALKGLAAATAHHLADGDDWRKGDPKGASHARLFGTTEASGAVIFHDAWYIPGSAKEDRPIAPDVMTVHHKDYYQGTVGAAPTDMDSPTPIPFLTATGKYLVALEVAHRKVADARERLDEALQLLQVGLEELGIGAKTSSGYGRARLHSYRASQVRQVVDALINAVNVSGVEVALQIANQLEAELGGMPIAQMREEVAKTTTDKRHYFGRMDQGTRYALVNKFLPRVLEAAHAAEGEATDQPLIGAVVEIKKNGKTKLYVRYTLDGESKDERVANFAFPGGHPKVGHRYELEVGETKSARPQETDLKKQDN